MAAANVSNGPNAGQHKGGKSAAGKPNPRTAPAKPQGKPGRGGRHSGGSKKK